MGRNTRYLIIIPAILFALFAKPAKAEAEPGLNTVYYTIDTIPPIQSDTQYPVCGSEIENNINRSYDGEPFEDCTNDYFMVQMTGYIDIPEHDTIEFWLASDDGGEISIGGNTFGVWQDQGCSATMSGPLELEAGSQPLELFMYENGGGTCVMLAWKIDDNDWEIVPEWAFTTSSTPQTTSSTTTVPSTTVPVTNPTTTTVQETTTTVPATTTSVENSTSTTSTSSSTTSTSTSTSVPQTTTTESTTTTTEPPPVPTPVTQPQIVEPEPVDTVVPVEPEPDETDTTEPPAEEAIPETTLPEETTTTDETYPETTIQTVVDTTLPEATDTPLEAPLSDEEVENILVEAETTEALVEALAELSSEQVEQVVEALLAEEPTEEQATALASSPEVLAVISTEQAAEIFEALDVAELSDTQTEELIAAIESAPTEIREEFEDTIDIFGEGLDDYTPTGSNIPVGERRTLIAVTAGITLAAAGTRIRR
jgi:hypothetical protein